LHRPGNLASACVRMVTVEDMYQLADEIIKVANSISKRGM
jgi:hypothetical protein